MKRTFAGGPSTSQTATQLSDELVVLRRQVQDLKIELQTSNEHGDLLQEQLYRLNASLQAEVRERQAAEQKLQQLIHAAQQKREDLEIMVQILTDQGDEWAEEGGKARIDALTGIANRRGFDEHLSQEWATHRQQQRPLSLLLCDVDDFKLYNDHYGHQAGDECLKSVAGALSSCLRAGDLVARYGGEEFAIILPRTDLTMAKGVGERARAAVFEAAVPHSKSAASDRVTISLGAASRIPPRAGDPDARLLVEAADRFLYSAKRNGRNCVVCEEQSLL